MANPPITIGELTDVPAPLSAVASPWAQEVSRRITHRFATVAERDAKYPAASAGTGAMCAIGPIPYVSNGSRWIGNYAHGAGLTQSGQLVAAGATVTMQWSFKAMDTDGYVPGSAPWTTVTIPAGLDGVYMVGYSITSTEVGHTPFSTLYCDVTGNSRQFDYVHPQVGTKSGSFLFLAVGAGAGVTFGVRNGTPNASYFSGSFNVIRLTAANPTGG